MNIPRYFLHFACDAQSVLQTNTIGNIKRDFYLDVLHHFKSDLINNIDHMRISGTEPLSVILSQSSFKKLKSYAPTVPKKAKAKRDGVINPQNYYFNQFKHRKTIPIIIR